MIIFGSIYTTNTLLLASIKNMILSKKRLLVGGIGFTNEDTPIQIFKQNHKYIW